METFKHIGYNETIDSAEICKDNYYWFHYLLEKSDINKLPLYEIKKYERLLYQFGPYLLMSNKDKIELCKKEVSYNQMNVLRFMIDGVDILALLTSKASIKDIKSYLISKIKELNTFKEYGNKYASKMIDIILWIITNIRDYQFDKRLMESAMLNYLPIVPYQVMLKKPEVTSINSNKIYTPQEEKEIDDFLEILTSDFFFIKKKVDGLLYENLIDILFSSECYISTENYKSQYGLKNSDIKLSSQLFELFTTKKILFPEHQYFFLSYIIFNFKEESYRDIYDSLKRFKDSILNISNSEVSVSSIMESMTTLDFPPIIENKFLKYK